jgi:glucose-1-phosphatase
MIKNILFDIGSVLVEGDQEATAREYRLYSTKPKEQFSIEQVFIPGVQHAFERGEISPEQYYQSFLEHSGCRISFRHFAIIWAKHFVTIPSMILMGQKLARNLKVYFLSNTNPLHIPVLYHIFPNLLFFHGQALSYELGAMKPDPAFFQRALEKLDLDPAECLYIDDQARNVAGAKEFGLRSIHHLDPEQTASNIYTALKESGISIEKS